MSGLMLFRVALMQENVIEAGRAERHYWRDLWTIASVATWADGDWSLRGL